MYRVRIKSHFSSAHNLREYQGACERLHGHNWKVEAYLKSETLDKLGMVEDFKIVKKLPIAILILIKTEVNFSQPDKSGLEIVSAIAVKLLKPIVKLEIP